MNKYYEHVTLLLIYLFVLRVHKSNTSIMEKYMAKVHKTPKKYINYKSRCEQMINSVLRRGNTLLTHVLRYYPPNTKHVDNYVVISKFRAFITQMNTIQKHCKKY